MLDGILKWIKEAGAESEDATDRNGLLSYHAESHALGVGFGAGFFFGYTGDEQLLGIILSAIIAGLRGVRSDKKTKIFQDIKDEPAYALFGLVIGVIAGGYLSGRVTI